MNLVKTVYNVYTVMYINQELSGKHRQLNALENSSMLLLMSEITIESE